MIDSSLLYRVYATCIIYKCPSCNFSLYTPPKADTLLHAYLMLVIRTGQENTCILYAQLILFNCIYYYVLHCVTVGHHLAAYMLHLYVMLLGDKHMLLLSIQEINEIILSFCFTTPTKGKFMYFTDSQVVINAYFISTFCTCYLPSGIG